MVATYNFGSVYRHCVSCKRNSLYNFGWILLRLCMCFCQGLKMCMTFDCNPQGVFVTFFAL